MIEVSRRSVRTVRWSVIGVAACAVMVASAVGGCGSSKPSATCGPGLTKAADKAYDESGAKGASDLKKLGAQLRSEAKTTEDPKRQTLNTFADDLDLLATIDTTPGDKLSSFQFFIDEDAAEKACGAPLDQPSSSSSSSS
ncbi:hypothetical protein ABH926_007271 [Catenulispora sp. GP43]|uniref:hypothetical protein n=1 Tax=Catenulispora sp. GP43 TaxID=3156263 RepID=UPI003513DB0E